MNSEELEMRDYNEYQNFKVQSMRDALEEVWARSVEDKLFEDINRMSEEQFDRFIDSLNEEELDEFLTARSRARRGQNWIKPNRKLPTNEPVDAPQQGEKCYKDRIQTLLEKQRRS